MVLVGVMNLLGFAGLMLFEQLAMQIISIGIFGLSMGASFSLVFAVIGIRASNSQQVAELSGMAQSVGYLLAAFGPVLLGFVFDHTGSWLISLLIIQLVNAGMLLASVMSVRRL